MVLTLPVKFWYWRGLEIIDGDLGRVLSHAGFRDKRRSRFPRAARIAVKSVPSQLGTHVYTSRRRVRSPHGNQGCPE